MKRYIYADVTTLSDEDLDARCMLATNPRTPSRVLRRLAHDPSGFVQGGVASNPNTPEDVLLAFLTNPLVPHGVAVGVAKNPNITERVARLLVATSSNTFTLAELFSNPHVPPAILSEALIDCAEDRTYNNEALVSRILANPSFPDLQHYLNLADPYFLSKVAKNPNLSVDVLNNLSYDPHYAVRVGVAYNPGITFEIANKLAHDSEPFVRLAVARSIYTPVEILEQLANDPEGEISEDAANNLADHHINR